MYQFITGPGLPWSIIFLYLAHRLINAAQCYWADKYGVAKAYFIFYSPHVLASNQCYVEALADKKGYEAVCKEKINCPTKFFLKVINREPYSIIVIFGEGFKQAEMDRLGLQDEKILSFEEFLSIEDLEEEACIVL